MASDSDALARGFDLELFGGTGGPRPYASPALDTSKWIPWPAGPGLCDRCGKHAEQRAKSIIFHDDREEEYVGYCQACCDRFKWEKALSQLPTGPIVVFPGDQLQLATLVTLHELFIESRGWKRVNPPGYWKNPRRFRPPLKLHDAVRYEIETESA